MVLDAFKHLIRHGKQTLENKSPPRTAEAHTHAHGSASTSTRSGRTGDRKGANYEQEQQQYLQVNQPQVVHQQLSTKEPLHSPGYRREAELLVKEENEKKNKMPLYKGLENYKLLEKMGDGAFSNVYKALDLSAGKKVAVKVVRKYELNASQDGNKHLNPQFKKRPRVTERANILKEVQIMRGISHPSIVKLLHFFESEEHYFLILELMEGGELFHQIVKLTYFSENLARHVILQVAQGIRHLHEERGVVHRDIKPENLLFERIPLVPSDEHVQRPYDEEKMDEGKFIPGVGGGEIGRVKIADFGLSKIVWDNQTMTPCGTVGYTAPEIVKDERYSKSVDMWALGCVLYTLLCGFPPFYDESINVLTEKVARGYYTFLSPWWDDISASSKDLISHLLCVDPTQRYTIDQFLAHPWCNEAPAPPPPPTPMTAPVRNIDSPLLQSLRGGGREARSPVPMKDTIDFIYAYQRAHEEQKGRGGGGELWNLNESDEDAEMEDQQTMANMRMREQGASGKSTAQQRQRREFENGYGNGKDLNDGRAGMRDPPRRQGKQPFELDIGNATLMQRRQHRRVGQSPLAQELTNVTENGFGFDKYNTPGSPMQVG